MYLQVTFKSCSNILFSSRPNFSTKIRVVSWEVLTETRDKSFPIVVHLRFPDFTSWESAVLNVTTQNTNSDQGIITYQCYRRHLSWNWADNQLNWFLLSDSSRSPEKRSNYYVERAILMAGETKKTLNQDKYHCCYETPTRNGLTYSRLINAVRFVKVCNSFGGTTSNDVSCYDTKYWMICTSMAEYCSHKFRVRTKPWPACRRGPEYIS